jgi:hypothetical protein
MARPVKDALELIDSLIGMMAERLRLVQVTLDALKVIRGAAAAAPPEMRGAFLDTIRNMLADETVTPKSKPSSVKTASTVEASAGGKTHYERILDYFVERNNQPATNQMIRTALSLSRGSVAMVLYKSHADDFERVPDYGMKSKAYWRIKEAVYPRLWQVRVGEGQARNAEKAPPKPSPQPGKTPAKKAARPLYEAEPDDPIEDFLFGSAETSKGDDDIPF